MNAKLLSYVLRAKNRRTILLLLTRERLTPAQIMKRTGMYESHISRTLRELVKQKLIICENPNERRFRFYSMTSKGKEVAKEIENILKEINS
jgi:predicted transcriptional regulator